MRCCTPTCKKWTVFSLGIFFVLIGVLAVVFWGDLVDTIKYKELSMANKDTEEYKMWVETPIPMYIEFYLYNWTNCEEVSRNWSVKPSFKQMGPYTYSERHIRKQVIFNDNNHTITYKTQRIWHFEPTMSGGSLDDKITTINPILLTVGSFVKYKHPILKIAVNFFIEEKRVNLTVTATAREWLFDGYDDPMLHLLKKLHLRNINIPFDKFGWFAQRNESIDYDGTFNMYDGTDDIQKLGRIIEWNFTNKTEYYSGYCGQVNGTSGELWYPVGDAPNVQVFSNDICSSVTLDRDGDDELLGLLGHKFKMNVRMFDNGTKYPEMACFNSGEVIPSGVRNVSLCKFQAPAFVSFPHFYLADPYYRNAIDGMHPNKTEHEFFLSVEPETGIPLRVQAAVQINLRLQKIDKVKILENVKEYFIPCMWFKQHASLTTELANQAKMLLILPAVGEYTGYGVIAIGCLLLFIFGFITIRKQWKGSEEEGLINHENF